MTIKLRTLQWWCFWQ